MRRIFLFSAVFAASFAVATIGAQSPPSTRNLAATPEQRTARYLERIRLEPPALRAFLRAMPKGADLHSHLTGAVYAESYIEWAAVMPLCIDLSTSGYVEAPCRDDGSQRPAADALRDPVLYRRLIDALSTRFWNPSKQPGHYQFFDSFRHFAPVVRESSLVTAEITARAVAEVAERAALQNVLHLELMLSSGSAADEATPLGVVSNRDDAFATARERSLAGGFRERLAERRQWLDRLEDQRRSIMRCGSTAPMKGCSVSLRYVSYAGRGFPPDQVFAQALFAFELAAADPRIAGVNIVMPEDGYISMRDYDLHMRMYAFLRKHYPSVSVSMHAGELSLGLVPPEQLGLHVRKAIEIAGANRIGHATDVMYDANPFALLREMARRRIAVEISLSSSDLILGVRGSRHPLRQLLRAGVPVVLATDDEGVSRSDLTNEYQRAVEEHGLSYPQIKQISLNSIDYSFLPPDEKSRLTAKLRAAFAEFEVAVR